MRVLSGRSAAARVQQIAARSSQLADVEPQVQRIIEDVRRNRDRALRKYAERWDGLATSESLKISRRKIQAAWREAPREFRKALTEAASNIRRFCQWQKPREWRRNTAGRTLGQLVRPLESVGSYVPGGRYPLVSTLLMTVIPAQVAGVRNIRVVSPQPKPEMLAAAGMLGVEQFYRIGGAQAIAALAYGTESVPRVDKIVGPGNVYVTAAKKLVAFDCAIDFLAGPTEVLIVAEEGNPEFIAADLVAQAEHDPAALAVFVTTSKKLAESVLAVGKRIARNNAIAKQSLADQGV
ncbi:MAG TPA: histidinol dehydrogenase, partial [Terriglobales bacterium]